MRIPSGQISRPVAMNWYPHTKDSRDEERILLEMRKKQQNQMPLVMTEMDHPRAEEPKRISDILDRYPIICRRHLLRPWRLFVMT